MAPLTGQTIALAEGRQLEELAQMLEQEGASILRCPMVSILNPPEVEPVVAWLKQLAQNKFDYVIFFTGEGVRRLLNIAEDAGIKPEVLAGLEKTRLLTRGPKPVKALREVNLKPTVVADAPTTEGVISSLGKEDLKGKIVGVQLYSPSNPALEKYLSKAGATMAATLPYIYAPAADADSVANLIGHMSRGEVNFLVLTSSPQVDRLFEVAGDRNLQSELGLAFEKTRIAAVGPVVAENLHKKQAPVHICPSQGFVMKNLVKHILADVGHQPNAVK